MTGMSAGHAGQRCQGDAAGGLLPTCGAAGPCGAALDLQLVYNKDTHQVTIYATLTPPPPTP